MVTIELVGGGEVSSLRRFGKGKMSEKALKAKTMPNKQERFSFLLYVAVFKELARFVFYLDFLAIFVKFIGSECVALA
jgi:hypothetical protein